MSDYIPIPCAFHEQLEFAVLRRQRLQLRYLSDTGEIEAVVLPLDVATRDSAEWLTCQLGDGHVLTLRLDRLRSARPA